MNNSFYTHVYQYGNQILVSGYQNKKRFVQRVKYKPFLFVNTTNETSRYTTIDKRPVERIDFDSIRDARDFIDKYSDIDNFTIYGMTNFQYPYIYDTFKDIKPDTSLLKTAVLDIEVAKDPETGYSDIEKANNEITAITLMYKDITFVLGLDDYDAPNNSIKYIKCKDEVELLTRFVKIWTNDIYRPDVVSGWNIEVFDIPYIINRIAVLIDEDTAKKLSPFGVLEKRRFEMFGKPIVAYHPVGICVLDYLSLYKKFTYSQQPQYSLDFIAEYELGEKKIDYKTEYGTLDNLRLQNHQLFIDYNIHDCTLIWRLDNKMKLLDLVYTFAYDSKINFVDALTTVRSWDVIIHNYLLDQYTVIPPNKNSSIDTHVEGAYVKDPIVGRHNWVVSFDVQSLYPHLIMQYNISPDTYRGRNTTQYTVNDLLNKLPDPVKQKCAQDNLAYTANNCFYTKEFKGFLPALMEELFDKRNIYKNLMLEAQQKLEDTGDERYKYDIAQYNNLQMATKIKLNSAYGMLANPYCRWFETAHAQSITLSGQLTIRWAEKIFNAFFNKYFDTAGVDYVIAIDTDSCYVNMSTVVDKLIKASDRCTEVKLLNDFCAQIIQPVLERGFKHLADRMFAYRQAIKMKREAIADRGIFIAKKRYILSVLNNEGVTYAEPKIKMMGIEAVRSSTPPACRRLIKQILPIILYKNEDDVRNFVNDSRQQFKTLEFADVAFPRTVNGLTKYHDSVTVYKKATPIHVRGALVYNAQIKKLGAIDTYDLIFEQDKIKFCYLKLPNILRENVISVPQELPTVLKVNDQIDYDTQFDKGFVEPITKIIDKIGWQLNKRPSLLQFFN